MFDREDPNFFWVSPDSFDGDGSFDSPFPTIEEALNKVQPGQSVILKDGIYKDDITIQISGTATKPIRICGDEGALVEILNGCWFFYDTCDLIISNLTFKEAPVGAISMIGACMRNRFELINFIDCGRTEKASCTIYIGGSGAECNVIENCNFLHNDSYSKATGENTSIGIMISEGDIDGNEPIRHHICRRNKFTNYGYGILIGSNNATVNPYGHIVELNILDNCQSEGVLVKCGDTQIRGNLIKNSKKNSIKITAGIGNSVENNRIENCAKGIEVNGCGHTVNNNCIIQCCEQAITVCGQTGDDITAANNLFIENNTIIHCGISSSDNGNRIVGIKIEPGTTSIIQQNLVYGSGKPYFIEPISAGTDTIQESHYVVIDNIVSDSIEEMSGFKRSKFCFENPAEGNYTNESGYGAKGWVLLPEAFDPNQEDLDTGIEYEEVCTIIDDDGNLLLPEESDQKEIIQSYFTESGMFNSEDIES
jgi:hypothetical protein